MGMKSLSVTSSSWLWKVVWSVVAIAVVSFPFVGERKKASKQAGRNEVAVPLCRCAF